MKIGRVIGVFGWSLYLEIENLETMSHKLHVLVHCDALKRSVL